MGTGRRGGGTDDNVKGGKGVLSHINPCHLFKLLLLLPLPLLSWCFGTRCLLIHKGKEEGRKGGIVVIVERSATVKGLKRC